MGSAAGRVEGGRTHWLVRPILNTIPRRVRANRQRRTLGWAGTLRATISRTGPGSNAPRPSDAGTGRLQVRLTNSTATSHPITAVRREVGRLGTEKDEQGNALRSLGHRHRKSPWQLLERGGGARSCPNLSRRL